MDERNGSTMTPLGLVSMRKAASLAFALPGIEVDIVHDGAVIARIERRFAGVGLPLSTTLLSPCAFRSAVGRAITHCRHGGTSLFLGLEATAEPTLHYHVPFSGASRPLGMVVARVDDIVVHAFATHVPLTIVRRALCRLSVYGDLPDEMALNAAWDPITDITLVYCEVRIGLLAALRPRIERAMESLHVEFAVEEILSAVGAPSHSDS